MCGLRAIFKSITGKTENKIYVRMYEEKIDGDDDVDDDDDDVEPGKNAQNTKEHLDYRKWNRLVSCCLN